MSTNRIEARLGAPAPESRPNAPLDSPPAKPSRLWLFFVAAFALQLAAWVAWFVIAGKHPVQEVPLATAR